MTKPSNIEAIEAGSGISWEKWLQFFDAIGAKDFDHASVAKQAYDQIVAAGLSTSAGWWAQSVAVAYEQHIGRRKPGQQSSGLFNVAVSKTLIGDMDEVLARWIDKVDHMSEFRGVTIAGDGRTSKTDKWCYWRCSLEDSTVVSVSIQAKPSGDKSILTISHEKLESSSDGELWREYWKQFIAELG